MSQGVVANHRQRRGWSQAALAERIHVSRAEVSGIETGRLVPSVQVALRLAKVLGVSVEELFGRRESPESTLPWAWTPEAGEQRAWRASVNGAVRLFPVESTAAGTICHDSLATPDGLALREPNARPDRTLVLAGCDPLVGLLARSLAEEHDIRLLPLPRSSGAALDLLRRGLVHVAGIHLTDGSGHSVNDREVGARVGAGYRLIHQLEWQMGVAMSPLRRERTMRALFTANIRWVNREEGSSARSTFDTLLGRRRRPRGYDRVVRGHHVVAATVASGWADAGVCVRPSAAEHRLEFITLQRESYELCVADDLTDDPRIVALEAVLRSRRYREFVNHVPGCSATRTGDHRSVRAGINMRRGRT